MTQAELRLCSLLLQEHFGEIVEKVGNSLLRTGPRPLRLLVGDTGLLPDQVKKALCVLIQHSLVRYEVQPRGSVEYEARSERILRILRYPRYIYTAKTLYGDPGELLVEELLLHGHLPMSCAVARVADRLTETMEDGKTMDYTEVSSTFVRLADTHFIQRCPIVPESPRNSKVPPAPAPALAIAESDMYVVPRLSLVGKGKRRHSCDEEEEGENKAKRQKQEGGSSETPPDDGIYWQVNLERFHQHFRAQALVSAVASRMDQTSSEVVRTMLRMSEVTTASGASHTQPLSSNEIFRSLPAGYNIGKQVLDQYLALLADDPLEFVGKSGDSGGGTYTVNLHKALVSLATATLESIVEESFGSRCARIFRLLLRKKHLEQKQVEDFAMIPAKEAKDMLYRMLSENLVSLQEIPKTPDHAPSRTFYLYTVNVMAAARMLLHRCYKVNPKDLLGSKYHRSWSICALISRESRPCCQLLLQGTVAAPSPGSAMSSCHKPLLPDATGMAAALSSVCPPIGFLGASGPLVPPSTPGLGAHLILVPVELLPAPGSRCHSPLPCDATGVAVTVPMSPHGILQGSPTLGTHLFLPQSVANLMERRQHEMRENKRLLEKSQRVEAILASMQATGAEAAQLHEVEEMITGPERQQLENLKRNVNKIDASENQVDETIFVLESFIESTMKRP
ncbi:DNA-directed RNA polymerase III subunit RPC3 isoform X1 [Oenanthe melanoleuca]|uniref:DNA-directed RNA polymerase III subunit RPC3 isoform X1 n=1 Tax=Oenanthe melanoleuca TaxID=2939378 RepID=UPI0024C1988D|nr:DNA-directed RNA polymerase III subunit RPC3 isoform X1 [Oenanthe melanoleuca]